MANRGTVVHTYFTLKGTNFMTDYRLNSSKEFRTPLPPRKVSTELKKLEQNFINLGLNEKPSVVIDL